MATTAHAIKQLKKAGASLRTEGRRVIAQLPAARIEVFDQDGDAISIYVIRNGAQDDVQSDYFAGSFRSNIKNALELAEGMVITPPQGRDNQPDTPDRRGENGNRNEQE